MAKLPAWVRLVREPRLAGEGRLSARAIREPEDIVGLVGERLRSQETEVFIVVTLDAQSKPINLHEVSRGLVNSALVHPREVFRCAIADGATGLIVAHNHPSGDPTPSAEDRATTRQLAEAGRLLDLPVYDHVVIGADRFTSLAVLGAL